MAEDPKQRVDRELGELLQELRVTLPGVQVLFAFLLTVPFSQRFSTLSPATTKVYFAPILLTAAATGLLMSPSAHHRVRFRQGSKEQMIKAANTFALAGMVVLSVAMGTSVYVVADLLYAPATARITSAAVTVVIATLWFAVPFLYRRQEAEISEPSG
ncbi:MAG: hypothetical protein HYX34_16030 [Actinobacteria bacterium]|nr:hypothetical protein [Actinomycetota bacterium]